MASDKCPVDHKTPAAAQQQADKCPVDHASVHSDSSEKCPIDHTARTSWTSIFSTKNDAPSQPTASSSTLTKLPADREVSSIPRMDGSNWVYPSQAQFYAAMERKNHNPHAPDMKVIVPIHNAVNERAWTEVMKWEVGQGGERCGGVKLVSFKGRPNERTPKARWKTLFGYTPPFDRHDWIVNRCGTRVRYVIDFYTGRSSGNNPSFYLDVRPALDSWEGVRLRAEKFLSKWAGDFWVSSPSSPSSKPAS